MSVPRRSINRLLVSVGREGRWAAWLENDRVIEFKHEHEGRADPAGDIHLGRITRVDRGLGAAFVEIGTRQAAFLPLNEVASPPVEGATAIVQIERDGRGDKGPRVTTRIALAGAHLVLLPTQRGVSVSERISEAKERSRLSAEVRRVAEPGEGFMVRTAAAGAQGAQIRDEAAGLRSLWRNISDQARTRVPPAVLYRQPSIDLQLLRDCGGYFDEIVYDHRHAAEAATAWCRAGLPRALSKIAFRRGTEWNPARAEILEQIEDALQPIVGLHSGGSIVIEPTEALTVIDVNAESAASTRVDVAAERALLGVNLAAADAVARQLRLRNIGGIVVVDFIDLRDRAARRQVVGRLRAAVTADSAPVWIGAMSQLGLVEMTRKRRGPTLAEIMTAPCPTCGGTGRLSRSMDED